MKATFRFSLALLLLAALAAGCGKKGSSPTAPAGGSSGVASDRAQITEALSATPQLVEDGEFESAAQASLGDGAPGTAAAIRPLFFWRNITSVQRTFEFSIGDSEAIVTIHKLLKGTFNIATGVRPEATVLDSARLTIVRKPLVDQWERRILLRRVPAPPGPLATANADLRRVWRVAASSGVEVTSRAATTQIVSLEIKSATRDTVITDPLAFFRLRRLIRFDAGDTVALTVVTPRNDDVVVLLHRGLRARFHNNGDNSYTARIAAPLLMGVQHLGVNALSHGTLFDDAAPYDSRAWIVPYVVNPTPMAEFMP
jgi:hypothetical protein